MPADAVIVRAGPVAVPLDYELPTGTEIVPKVVTATLDGSNAGGSFLAVLEILAPDGTVTARCLRQESIAAGASAAVSWFPGGGVDDSAGTSDVDVAGVEAIASPSGTLTITSPTGPTADVDMPATGVGAGTYGDATHSSQVTVDAEGRITGASSVPISGAAGAGGLIVLYDSGYLGADAASIDTGAGGVAAGHFCLVIVAFLRSTAPVTADNVLMTLNNDASALYNASRVQNLTNVVTGLSQALTTNALIGDCPSANATGQLFGSLIGYMPAYDGAANFKAGNFESNAAQSPTGSSIINLNAITYQSTTAISRVKIVPGTGGANWKAGSRLVIYGAQ